MTTVFDDYLDLCEAARQIGIHPQSLRRLIKRGQAPAILFRGVYLFERYAFLQFRANYNPQPGRKPSRRLL